MSVTNGALEELSTDENDYFRELEHDVNFDWEDDSKLISNYLADQVVTWTFDTESYEKYFQISSGGVLKYKAFPKFFTASENNLDAISHVRLNATNELGLMDAAIDGTELADAADALVQTFQADAAREAGIFHHLITLPTYHTAALSTDTLTEGYFGDLGMLAYVRDVQRKEIRGNLAAVKHQDLAGSNIGDDHKEYFLGEKALLAGGAANTMNQF